MGRNVGNRYCAGFGMTEALIAMAVLGVAASMLASVFKNVDVQTRKSRTVSTMVALESSLLAAMEDKDNFQPIAAKLEAASAGGTVPPLSLRAFELLVAKHPTKGNPLLFSSEGSVCTGSRCEISVELDFEGHSDSIMGAYRIALTPEAAKVFVAAPLGGSFQASDYTLRVPRQFYANPTAGSSCSAGGGIVRKMNKLTGEVVCWGKVDAGDRCPRGSIMRGFIADDASGRLKPICRPLRKVACKDHASAKANEYLVLKSFNPYFMDPDVGNAWSEEEVCTPLLAREIEYKNDFRCPLGHNIYHLVTQAGPCRLTPDVPETWGVSYDSHTPTR